MTYQTTILQAVSETRGGGRPLDKPKEAITIPTLPWSPASGPNRACRKTEEKQIQIMGR